MEQRECNAAAWYINLAFGFSFDHSTPLQNGQAFLYDGHAHGAWGGPSMTSGTNFSRNRWSRGTIYFITGHNHGLMYTYNVCCCILKTLFHRFCNNNITDVAQEVMLHMQHILPWARCLAYNKSVDTWVTGKHKLCCPWADVALGLCPRDNINPLCNISCVYQLPMYQLLRTSDAIISHHYNCKLYTSCPQRIFIVSIQPLQLRAMSLHHLL